MAKVLRKTAAVWTAAWAAALASTAAMPALADEVDAGRAKARSCTVCHGPLGISVHPEAPNIAGHPADYLKLQLRAYRSGARMHAVMNVIAKPLADDDIDQLAAWFAAIKVEAISPR